MAKFTVDRSKWYRGQGYKESMLLRSDGTMCCIGFVGLQCGVSAEALMGKDTIWRTRHEQEDQKYAPAQSWPHWMTDPNAPSGKDITAAYVTNDDPDITDDVREARLKALFAHYGDEIVFEG